MKSFLLGIVIVGVTAVLVVIGWFQAGGLQHAKTRSAKTPVEAARLLFTTVQNRNLNGAYSQLANKADVDQADFIHELNGDNGSLLTYATLEKFDVWPLKADDERASLRVKLRYSTAVGPLDDVRDLSARHEGDVWKVIWPTTRAPKLPPQVIPVNYLRWDVINRTAADDWGVSNVDGPQVRIVSMNPVQELDRLVLVGEVVNEDTIPAWVNVGATLLRADGSEIQYESSFDKIAHTLLPKQVSPYRIDFPGIKLQQVKSVRMDPKALLVPASADPVIEVAQQQLETDALGKRVLHGELINQSGETVNIPHVLAAYYDAEGKVVWVSDGYVDQALLPQIPVPFAVDLPDDIAPKVQTYRITVNYYQNNNS